MVLSPKYIIGFGDPDVVINMDMISNQERRELITNIYTYFPAGLQDAEKQYYTSKKHKNWLARRTQLPIMESNWDKLLQEIKSVFPDLVVEDWKEIIANDNGLRARFIIKNANEEDIWLVMNVSLLLPYFIFHQSAFSSVSQKIHRGDFREVCFDIPESVKYIYLIASELIKKYFPNYKEMDSQTAVLQLDNIIYDGTGLLDYEQSDILRKLTVFNALFSTNYL